MIALDNIAIRQGRFTRTGLSFHISTGDYAAIMGRTGSGKTSILEIICGLRRPAAGRVLLDSIDVTALPPAARGIGYVPQDLALFSTMTVQQNIAFGPRVLGLSRVDIARRVGQVMDDLGISHLASRYPVNLSGGESQRVALGRAIATRPRVLLLDEPLGALDAQTRLELYGVLERIRTHSRATVLHVTHSRDEADRLADLLLTLDESGIVSTPLPTRSFPSHSPSSLQ